MLVKSRPITPAQRQRVKVVNPDLHKGRPVPHLVEHKNKKSGRNVYGEITMRHQGGGHKQLYRKIDFKRDKDGITAKWSASSTTPNRTAFLALLCYADGSAATSSPPRASPPACSSCPGPTPPSRPAIRCRCGTSPSARPYIASKCFR
jgi:large subunit ribosomal protein L2